MEAELGSAGGLVMTRPRGLRTATSAILAVIEAALVGISTLAVNAAFSDPPKWPQWLMWLPIPPVHAAAVSSTAAVLLPAVIVIWDKWPPSARLNGLFDERTAVVSPASLLRADQAVVRFRGERRKELVVELVNWCKSDPRMAVQMIVGRGGQGKTRLAWHIATQLGASGWRAGLVSADAPADAIAQLAQLRQPVLLVVDYAEARGAQVKNLTTATVELPVKVRFLLLARSAGEWRQKLAVSSLRLQLVADCPARALDSVDVNESGRVESWRQAVKDLAAMFRPFLNRATWTGRASQPSSCQSLSPI